ncbi:MAG: cytochrome b5-like heme/steroid binding domain-containing protein [archaeon]
MKTVLFSVTLIMLFFLLFGCTISVNPMDLNPANNYSVVTPSDQNAPLQTTNYVLLSAEEVTKHKAIGDCWMIIDGNVYDLSQYVDHPGGYTYVPYCGKDATEGYTTKGGRTKAHSPYADSLLAAYRVGAIGQTVIAPVIDSNAGKTENN